MVLLALLKQRTMALIGMPAAWGCLACAGGLSWMGVAAIRTVRAPLGDKQAHLWLPAALLMGALCLLPSPKQWRAMAWPAYWFGVFQLVYLFVPGAPLVVTRNGATSWLDLKLLCYQPAEMAKVAFVLAAAAFLAAGIDFSRLQAYVKPALIMFLPQALILKQPDLGSALLFPPTLITLLAAAKAKARHLALAVGSCLVIGLVVSINTIFMPENMRILKPHQQDRIQALWYAWNNDSRMAQGEGFQQDRCMMMIAASGTEGYGKAAGPMVKYVALPEEHNDMVMAVVASKWGLRGLVALIALQVLLMVSLFGLAGGAAEPFPRLVCCGFSALLGTQAMVNLGMCLGLLPITGLTLPFVSYGGSSLVFCWIPVGMALGMASWKPPSRRMRLG